MRTTHFFFREKRLDTHFRGVYYRPEANHRNPWVAWVCANQRVIQLGYFPKDLHAAMAVDYAKALIWGPFYKAWYSGNRRRRVDPPNLPFVIPTKLPFNPEFIAGKLCYLEVISIATKRRNQAEYEQIARRLAGQSV